MTARRTSVLFLLAEPIGNGQTGPARRAAKLAEVVAARCDVTVRSLAELDDLATVVAAHDVTVTQTLTSPRVLLTVARHAPRLVADLLAPLALETSAIAGGAASMRWRARQMISHMAAADLVLCTNEHQRDLLLGAALGAGLLDPPPPGRPLDERLVVVPHGIDPEPPVRLAPALRTGTLGPDDRIVVWGGGIWSWLDPLTAIRAVERLRPDHPGLKLAFIGLEHPDPEQRRAHAPLSAEVQAYVRDRGLEEAIHFRPPWLTREAYLGQLQEADAGIVLNGPTLEGRFASRTRVGDYLHAGLPVVCTAGDTMSELVAGHGLGELVAPGDVSGCAAAIERVLAGGSAVDREALRPLFWPAVAAPLVEYCAAATPPRGRLPVRALVARTVGDYPAFARDVLAAQGAAALAGGALRLAVRPLRRRAYPARRNADT